MCPMVAISNASGLSHQSVEDMSEHKHDQRIDGRTLVDSLYQHHKTNRPSQVPGPAREKYVYNTAIFKICKVLNRLKTTSAIMI